MKFTLSWLKDYLDTNADAETIARTLTAIGLEVESVTDHGAALKDFIVAEILHAEKHPNADKLRVCKVNNGKEELQIVCGAPNARAGIKVVLASPGVSVPNGNFVIKKSKIRSVESNGMLCSARELNLGQDSEGIMELPADAKVGESIVPLLGLDDPLFDIAITPNRGDCLGIYGIARDLAAAGLGELKLLTDAIPLNERKPRRPSGNTESPEFKSPVLVTLQTQGCKHFCGVYIKGVKNGPSPEWLKRRIESVGLRPISTLVDITNFFTVGFGRPLHVYDAKKLKGNIIVRDAKKGETLAALNDKSYTLDDGMVAITDGSGVIGIGGIIGGTSTGCDESTTDVFLEGAWFEPLSIAKTGRALQLDSDARHRFERFVDPEFTAVGVDLAAEMILELCGGEAAKPVIAGSPQKFPRIFVFDNAAVKKLGGVDITPEKSEQILTALGFGVKGASVSRPSWRIDVEGEADLVEEVLRIAGYDNIPAVSLDKPTGISRPVLTATQKRAQRARHLLASRGMLECVNWAFTSDALAAKFGGAKEELQLLNPISADLNQMRPSLLPNLLLAAAQNGARGYKDLALFELGPVFENTSPEGQKLVAGGLRCGLAAAKNAHKTERAVDLYDVKADVFALLESAGLDPKKLTIKAEAPAWYHPGRSATLSLGGKVVIGYFGELHPAILKSMDVEARAAAFEIFMDAIPLPKAKATKTKPALQVSEFQAVERDFAFVVDATLPVGELLKAVEEADKTLIKSVALFDIYQGKGVPEGKKSVALSVTLQAMDRTLTEDEIGKVAAEVVSKAGTLGASLRQ